MKHIFNALALLFSVCLFAPAVLAQHSEAQKITMFLPDRQGAVIVPLAGFKVEQGGLRRDGKQYKILAKGENGMVLSAFVEVAPHPGKSTEVRDDWWGGLKKNTPFKLDDIKLVESGSGSATEYLIHEFKGVKVEQKNVHAYYGGNEIWAEVHISKVAFKPADQELFDRILNNVQVLPTYSPSSKDWLGVASSFYMQQNYPVAANYYEKALQLEKQDPQLDKTLWKVLVDNLGMSYGISGDLKHAKEIFEYGISKDPNYPLFQYNMACMYGEMNDLDQALVYLKKAFELRANSIPGEGMPDPLTDSSFQRFKNNPKFVKAVKELPRS